MKKSLFVLFFLLVFKLSFSDWKPDIVSLGFSNNITAKPFKFLPLFYSQLHPGFTIGADYDLKKTDKHRWHQTIKLGYNYHRFLQHNIEIYSELGHDFILKRFSVTPRIGLGFVNAIPQTAVLEPNGNGGYERVDILGKPRFMFGLGLETSYIIHTKSQTRLFLNYQNKFQTPFVKGYVPVLPYVSITSGISIPLSNLIKPKKKNSATNEK